MRTAVYYGNKDIRIEEKPKPKIGSGEILVRVEASGICGSDVMEWYRIDRIPLILGHEVAGTIEEVGEGVKKFKKGQRVALAHHVPCGKCKHCLTGHEACCETLRKTNFDPGGFCEFLRLSPIHVEKGVFALPENVSFEEATFVEPLACIMRGQKIAGEAGGEKVLVIGSGIAGILHIHFAKFNGATSITATDISEQRLKLAEKFGASKAINAKDYKPEAIFDLVIVTSGAPVAIKQALDSVDIGGTVLLFAPVEKGVEINIPYNRLFWRNEIALTSSYAASPKEYQEALDLIGQKKLNLKDMITHRLKLDETGLGFKLVSEAKESLKVIIFPQK